LEVDLMDAVFREIGVINVWLDDFEPDIPIFLSSVPALDPIAHYTHEWRGLLAKRVEELGRPVACSRLKCSGTAIPGFVYCAEHLVGEKAGPSDFAPLPLDMDCRCKIEGCPKIAVGFSGVCLEHLQDRQTLG